MSRKQFYILLSIYVTGLIAGTFLDFQVSQLLYDSDRMIGNFMNVAAMIPAAAIMSFCAGIVYWYCRDEYPALKYPSAVLPFAAGVAAFREIGQWRQLDLTVRIAIGLAIGLLIILIFHIVKPVIYRDRFILAVTVLLVAIVASSSIGILKQIWGRRRYYSMEDPVTQFMVWYIPHPFASSDFYRSFPSGHTGFASLILFMPYLSEMAGIKADIKITGYVSVAWVWAVMYSRIVYGAHFLTDVCFGAIIGLVCCYIAQKELRKLTEYT